MNSPTRLYLVRHAEVEVAYQRVFGGRIDMELSPRGHEQASALAKYMQRISLDAIYTSPMRRVQQTLKPLAAHHPIAAIILDDLREVDFGAWTGLSWEQVHERYQVRAFDWLEKLEQGTIPDAESTAEFKERLEPCLRSILCGCAGQSVAVVCHGGVIRMLLAILLDLPIRKMAGFEIDYASLTLIDCLPHKAEIQLLNFVPWRDLP
jgi:broad specificity phosphatase PhoE